MTTANELLELFRGLDQLSHRFRLAMNGHSRRVSGLTIEQALALFHIHLAGGILTVSDLASLLERASHSTTVLVDRLEVQGFVTRRRKPDNDRRQVWVEITPEGIARVDLFRASLAELLPRLLEGVTDQEVDAMQQAVVLLNSRMDGAQY